MRAAAQDMGGPGKAVPARPQSLQPTEQSHLGRREALPTKPTPSCKCEQTSKKNYRFKPLCFGAICYAKINYQNTSLKLRTRKVVHSVSESLQTLIIMGQKCSQLFYFEQFYSKETLQFQFPQSTLYLSLKFLLYVDSPCDWKLTTLSLG